MVDNFDMIFWSAAKNVPAFYQEEVTALQSYLDNGGNLFINGQDIGYDHEIRLPLGRYGVDRGPVSRRCGNDYKQSLRQSR